MRDRKHKTTKLIRHITISTFVLWSVAVLVLLVLFLYDRWFEGVYEGRTYPNVFMNGLPFGGKTVQEIESYWQSQSVPFQEKTYEFVFEDHAATISGTELGVGFDAQLAATQAYLVGRSRFFLSNLMTKYFFGPVNLPAQFHWDDEALSGILESFAYTVDIPVSDALFDFKNGRVTTFRPSRDGRKLDIRNSRQRFVSALANVPLHRDPSVKILADVQIIKPETTTDETNMFGVKELIGRGYSQFAGSIPGRIHNVALAASRLHGVLVKPGETFSFNKALGDVSAATGYQTAYIIKDGRTVLGDGGGVCQVSTTLFRALLNAGLPIIERHAHAYRVHYYEDGGFKAGLDATVFAPTVDLKFTNDTPASILIQTKTDTKNLTLTFELYGTSDGRKAEILNHKVWGVSAPPPPLYQDDPTLSVGVTRQVDFAAWGAKASFDYRVTRGEEVLQDTKFYSNFRPWQAVYLRGTKIE